MVRARAWIVAAGLSVVVAACAEENTWRSRPAAPQPPTRVVGGIVIATVCEDLPDLTDAEVASVVELAEKQVEGQRVRRIIHTRAHPGEHRWISLQFAYHDTRERIRFSRWVSGYWTESGKDGDGRGSWSVETEGEPPVGAQICAPGRSFLDGTPIPASDLVDIGVGKDLTADRILEIVDAVYNHVPPGEQLMYIGGEDDGAYEVMTERADTLRPLSGSTLEVRRERSGWKVSVVGEWVS